MTVLVFNVGSTTLKYALVDLAKREQRRGGLIDRIGQAEGNACDHVTAARNILEDVGLQSVEAIGHRIVQGGDQFHAPALVDPSVLTRLRKLDSLAPLHNPPARAVVEGLVATGVPQTLVFDTAYYATLKPVAYRYAVPASWYHEHGVRRYGFHGTSHQYVTDQAIHYLLTLDSGKKKPLRLISLHLGGGASVTASIDGVAVETSMGMTPLQGLVMATRSGDLDPAVIFHMMRSAKMTADEVDEALNKQSGLRGLCGDSDMRNILTRLGHGDQDATLAVELFVRRVQQFIGSFTATLGGLDGLIFTAGIGEHSPEIRSRICEKLGFLGIEIDENLNQSTVDGVLDISRHPSKSRTLVVTTDEEYAIAKQVIV
ncbi:MAG: acetate/propionate family kinase [Planctomycetota bacterium]